MGQIIGVDGFKKLLHGHEVNINDIKTKTFTVAKDAEIEAGDILVYTETPQVYKTIATTEAATTYKDKVAGIALATNVKLDRYFPQSADDKVKFTSGEKGANVIQGEVAVTLHGAAPSEGDKVYYNVAQRAFTKTSEGMLECPRFAFTGITEGNLTVVRVLY